MKNVVTSESDSILELFREVDELLEGSGEEQKAAMSKLRESEAEVSKFTGMLLSSFFTSLFRL